MVTIVLILVGIGPQLYGLNHSPSAIFNRDFCKFRGYVGQSSAMLCRWFLTIACIDRCLFTSTNVHLRLFSTIHRARKIIFITTSIWLIIPIHTLIFTDVRRIGYISCMMSTSSAAFYHTIYTIVTGGLTPPLIMLISTRILWKNLQLKRQRQGMFNRTIRENRRLKRDIQVLMMLLVQVLLFLIFTLPYMSFNLYLAITRSVVDKSVDRLSIESFMQLLTEVTVFVYPSITFYSNTLTSHTFRNEFVNGCRRILTCGRATERSRRPNRILPQTGTASTVKRNDLIITTIS